MEHILYLLISRALVLLFGKDPDRPFTWLIIDPESEDIFAAKMHCKCDDCKEFAGK